MQRVAGRGWAQMSPRVGEARLARGRDSVGAGWGSGGAGERASVDAMRRRGQREGGGKSPIGAHPDRNGRRGGWLGAVDAMQAAKRDACKTAAMNAGEMAGGAGRGGHKRDGREGRMRQAGQARAAGRKARSAMPRVACRCRMAQSPFGRTAGCFRRKAGRRWQHLRAMRDFGLLDAKKGPWRQDSRAMHPESPDCARKWMHRARMLPS